jgi:hypothetical protein
MDPSRLLRLHLLEDRTTPVSFGIPWPSPSDLTLSFAPDGTAIAGHQSNLFHTLDASLPRPIWQGEILQAFQTWANVVNFDVSVTADGGQPFGTPGRLQGDPRFGDIRVGAQPMSPEILAIAVPPDPFVAGTLAGDILLNSDVRFDYDRLFSVVLHEAGHALGLDHSNDPGSVMNEHSERTELGPSDVNAIQNLYGARPPDGSNGTLQTARRIDPVSAQHGSSAVRPDVVFAELSCPDDVDYYSLVTPANYRGPLTLRLQTAGVSLLEPRLTLFDPAGQVVGEASATDPFGSVLTVHLDQVQPNATYHARVQRAEGTGFGIGRYALAATLDGISGITPAALDQVMRGPYETLSVRDIDRLLLDRTHALVNVNPTNSTLERATRLDPQPGYPATVLDTVGSLTSASDVHYYRVTAPRCPADARVLTVTLAGLDDVNSVVPRVVVQARDHSLVPADILLNGSGTYAVQVTGVRAGTDYYLEVSAPSDGNPPEGNFDLHVLFGRQDADLPTFTTGTLSQTTPQSSNPLYVAESQLFQFVLSADATGITSGEAVQMSIFDSSGVEVLRLTARAGETVSGSSVFLRPGRYTVRFTGANSSGGPLAPLNYRVRGKNLSDPIGPALEDPTLLPMYRCPTDPALFQYPGDVISSVPFLWAVSSGT